VLISGGQKSAGETHPPFIVTARARDNRTDHSPSLTFAGQVLSGSTFAYSPTYFFTQAGISSSNAYKLNLGGTGMAFVGTCLSWFLIGHIGRRKLYLGGEILLCALLLLIGILSAATSSQGALWAQAALCMIWLFIYSLTVGPIAYCIISETSSVRLRAQTVVLARNTYQIVNIISGVLVPYQLNPTEWDWSGMLCPFIPTTTTCI
jgi:MFS transporter, SP family, general alpha glucoside:H+ symporter